MITNSPYKKIALMLSVFISYGKSAFLIIWQNVFYKIKSASGFKPLVVEVLQAILTLKDHRFIFKNRCIQSDIPKKCGLRRGLTKITIN